MLGVQFLALFAFSSAATYLALYRATEIPRVSTGTAWLSWTLLAIASGEVTTQAGTEGSVAVQAVATVLALLMALAFIGSILDKYPIESMKS